MLTNDWWNWIVSNYTITLGLATSLVIALLKIIAVLHPSEKANSITGLLQGWLFGFPGVWNGKDRRNS